MRNTRHENYEVLNLIGYGLAKFSEEFVQAFGFETKRALFEHFVEIGVAETIGTVKNRQDLFDHFFDNGRKGWWQKGDAYIHRKILIDSLFGDLDSASYADIVKMHVENKFGIAETARIKPIVKSKFKQLQTTGFAAETFFMSNYSRIEAFRGGAIEDARLFGDGYDFQVKVPSKFYLAEVKGLQESYGSVRLTSNEYTQAVEYGNEYCLVIVSNLSETPKMTAIFDPANSLVLAKQVVEYQQVTYHSKPARW